MGDGDKSTASVPGLVNIRGEWVSKALNFDGLPAYWSEMEASQSPDQWLSPRPHLHALRRMAILADIGAVQWLRSMKGDDDEKNRQIMSAIARGKSATAARIGDAVVRAQSYLTVLRDCSRE